MNTREKSTHSLTSYFPWSSTTSSWERSRSSQKTLEGSPQWHKCKKPYPPPTTFLDVNQELEAVGWGVKVHPAPKPRYCIWGWGMGKRRAFCLWQRERIPARGQKIPTAVGRYLLLLGWGTQFPPAQDLPKYKAEFRHYTGWAIMLTKSHLKNQEHRNSIK